VRTYERHQLKQDGFAQSTKQTISWAVEHRNKLIYGLMVAGIALIIVAGGSYLWSYRGQQANTALGAAIRTYEAPIIQGSTAEVPANVQTFKSAQERARAAHAEFQKVADQYGHTSAGAMARYMAAVTAVNMGEQAAGEKELKEIGDSGNKDVAALAKLALAGIYRDSGRNNEALPLYKSLVDKPTDSVPRESAQLELASFYESTNQNGEAAKVYQDLVKNSSGSGAAQVAAQRMGALKQQ
jgi:predicted negative regulator of RcsB-dependent stress response